MYQHILVTLDGSELSESVLPHLNSITKGCQKSGSVTLARVVEPLHLYEGLERSLPPQEKERLEKEVESQTRAYLDGIAAKLDLGAIEVKTEILHGDARKAIVEFAHKTDVDLIMIGTHGHSEFKKLVIGSVADRVVRDACVPVFLVRPKQCRL
jgi:nucleotide-binding universal stress UspA family protein